VLQGASLPLGKCAYSESNLAVGIAEGSTNYLPKQSGTRVLTRP